MQLHASEPLPCWIYRSGRKDEMYLYLAQEDGFQRVPEALRDLFGTPILVLRLDLHPGRRLAREDVAHVIDDLRHQGYHLQLPPLAVPPVPQA
jgi:uncharacterized protein YcgL (UPF0745 family)